jgi:arylsulfatase
MNKPATTMVALACLAASCARRERIVVHDLAAAAPFAELQSAWAVVRPGTLETELLEERGFERAAGFGSDDLSSMMRSPATLLVPLGTPAAGRLVIDVAPEPAYAGHDLEVAVAGTIVGRQRLAPGRQRFAVDVPFALKPTGRTRIRLRLPDLPSDARQGPFVARLYGLVAGDARDPGLDALARGAPRGVATQEGTAHALTQLAPSALRYAFLLPADAELAFAAEADAGRCAPTLRVRVDDGSGPATTTWSGRPDAPGAGREVRVGLRPDAGGPAWITLEAETPGGCAAAVRWIAPRILGFSPVATLQPAPLPDTPEVDALRRGLGGMGVVLVVLDAARASHLGCYRYPRPTTPEIDRLAADGIVFESHYTPAVFTYAAMAALWTSRAPDEGGGEWLAEGILPARLLTLPELLSAQGIRTAGFVANPSAGPAFGLDRGFAELVRLYREPWTSGPVPSADVFAGSLHRWLGEAKPPFFVYAHVREPHMPFAAPLSGPDAPLPPEAKHQGFWDELNRDGRVPTPAEVDHLVRLYDGNLRAADRAVGALRARLEGLGLWDRVAVIVTADHGEALHEHGHVGHNQQVYEESVHVPLVVRLPKGLGPRGARQRALTSHLDLAPTVADLMGVFGKGGSDRAFRGRSLLRALAAVPPPSAVASRTTGHRPVYAVRTGRHKYIFDRTAGREELYDLEADAGERRDLAPGNPLLAAVHRQMLGQWLAGLRREARDVARPARIDERDAESLRALGYVR